ncbi:DUF805 domain-containing protein [Sphingomicrobium marinum]|uniref:DUF805 domain-containing protein n=1 Tax=Sphingomicrobium marinum TaxID=1227950 RepID=UPI00223F7769|nr:hypothetical protein [Sphingomicrobium marinum]
MRMISDYFGDWTKGTLGRGRFALLYAGIVVVGLAIVFIAFGGMEVGSREAAAKINAMGPAKSGLLMLLVVAMQIAALNIIAKRGRDIGLPGLVTLLIFIALSFGAVAFLGAIGALLALAFVVALLVLPTGMLAKKADA